MRYIITTCLSAIVVALTSLERWGAVRELDTDAMATKRFILIAGVVLTVLTVSVIAFTYRQRSQRAKHSGNNSGEHGAK